MNMILRQGQNKQPSKATANKVGLGAGATAGLLIFSQVCKTNPGKFICASLALLSVGSTSAEEIDYNEVHQPWMNETLGAVDFDIDV